MTQFIIQITDDQGTDYYKRRVTTDDLNFVIKQLDQALSYRPRRRRKDAGQQRTEATQQQSTIPNV